MRETLKRIFDREPCRTIFLILFFDFVLFVFYRATYKNPAVDPERMG